MYCEYLRFAGCVTETAGDAEEGLAKLESFRPDVVVMDLALPRLNGLEATRRIKSSPATRQIRVIMLSGHLLPDFVESARAAGADAFCSKPCLPEDLLGEIRAVFAADQLTGTGTRRKPRT
jgi:CheY-like chemotaxis protein